MTSSFSKKLVANLLVLAWAVPTTFALALPLDDDESQPLAGRAITTTRRRRRRGRLSRGALIGIIIAAVVVGIIAVTLLVCCVCLKKCRPGSKKTRPVEEAKVPEPMPAYDHHHQPTSSQYQAGYQQAGGAMPQYNGVTEPSPYAQPPATYAPPPQGPPPGNYYK